MVTPVSTVYDNDSRNLGHDLFKLNCSKTISCSSSHQHVMEFRILLITIKDEKGSQMLTEKPVIVFKWREYFNDLLNCPATAREAARQ